MAGVNDVHVFNNNIIVSGSVTSSVGFKGDGSGLTNITSTAEWDGSRTGDSSITGSLTVSGSSAVVNLLNAEGGVSGSFSGSFVGDGSGLTGVASTLDISGSTGTGTVALKTQDLTITGTTNEIETSASAQTITVGLPNDVTITNKLTAVSGSFGRINSTIFSGSFIGNGLKLTNVSAEWDGSRNGDANITGSFVVSGSGVNIDLKGPTIIDNNIMVGNKDDLTAISIGQGALPSASVGLRESVAIGCNAGASLISGSNSVFIGNSAASASIKTIGDVAIGYEALKKSIGTDDGTSTNKTRNTAVGFRSLCANTTGQCNVAIGAQAGEDNTTGCNSIFIGNCAGGNSLSACDNVNIGHEARCVSTTGNYNVSIGNCAALNSRGDFSTAVGYEALKGAAAIPGDGNTAVGYRAGFNASGSSCKNVYLGVQAGPNGTTHEENQLYINNSPGTPLIKGDFLTCQVQFRGGVTGSSFTGSFVGDGSSLTGITADWDGSHIGKASITGSLILSGSDVKLDLLNAEAGASGSFSGSFQGDGSGLTGVSGDGDFSPYITASDGISIQPLTGSNSASNFTTIAGGLLNTGSGGCGFIGGGCLNVICNTETFGVIGGGQGNKVDSDHSVVVGGSFNLATGSGANNSFIGGGTGNRVCDLKSVVVGGGGNRACNCLSFIGGGCLNHICSNTSFIGGGLINCTRGLISTVVNGCCNLAAGACSFIGNGEVNRACADLSSIVTGFNNRICDTAVSSSILGGLNNITTHTNTFLLGSNLTSTKANSTFVNNLDTSGTIIGNTVSGSTIIASTISGSVISGSFVGDGSNLTGVISSATDSFKTITVAGQSDVVADSSTDTLTLAAGANVTLTTDAGTDTITIASAGGGSGTATHCSPFFTGSLNGIIAGAGAGGVVSVSASIHNIDVPANSTIAGGQQNKITAGDGSTNHTLNIIGAGRFNYISGSCSVIAGGAYNSASLTRTGTAGTSPVSSTFIGAGCRNKVESHCSAIVAGYCNTIQDGVLNHSNFIGAGNRNIITGSESFIGAGQCNVITGSRNSVLSGCDSVISFANNSTILNGRDNCILGSAGDILISSAIVGGRLNKICRSCRSTIVGGTSNTLHTASCAVAIGNSNCVEMASTYAFGSGNRIYSGSCRGMAVGFSNNVKHQESIALGYNLTTDCEHTAFVSNLKSSCVIRSQCLNIGQSHVLCDTTRSSILGGAQSILTGSGCSTIAGGRNNVLSGSAKHQQFIGAGCANTGSATNSFIGSGFKNFINHVGTNSGIVAGCCNTVEHANSFIVGSKLATDAHCTTYVNNFHVKGPQIGDTTIIFESLPTLDPGVEGQLYNDNGTLKISLG